MKPAEIVQTAEKYLGIPWVHQGRSPLGVDCIGLLMVVHWDLGLLPRSFDVRGYSRIPDRSFIRVLESHTEPGIEEVGAIAALIPSGNSAYHVGIIVDLNPIILISSEVYPIRKRGAVGSVVRGGVRGSIHSFRRFRGIDY